MKILLDTSVLVAAMVEVHPSHEWSLIWLQRTHRGEVEAIVSAHSLVELYAVLTRLPLRPPITPKVAQELIHYNLLNKVQVCALSLEQYWGLLERMSGDGVRGGQSYDWLIAYAGKVAGAEAIVTLNSRHFVEIGNKWNLPIITPESL